MKQNDFNELIEYIKHWHSIDSIKPSNEDIFYQEFLNLIRNYPDEREVYFDGEGSYFGKQITLTPFSTYGKSPKELIFEISYSKDKISVYSGLHNGFWYPEYLRMDNTMPGFIALYAILNDFLRKVFGL